MGREYALKVSSCRSCLPDKEEFWRQEMEMARARRLAKLDEMGQVTEEKAERHQEARARALFGRERWMEDFNDEIGLPRYAASNVVGNLIMNVLAGEIGDGSKKVTWTDIPDEPPSLRDCHPKRGRNPKGGVRQSSLRQEVVYSSSSSSSDESSQSGGLVRPGPGPGPSPKARRERRERGA